MGGEGSNQHKLKMLTTLHRAAEQEQVAYSKGALEEVLAGCSSWQGANGAPPLGDNDRARFRAAEQRMAADGLRVLAVAEKRHATLTDAESDMTLLGLVAMMDPPRAEARAAVDTCVTAGIRPVMITGDHPLTASTIARELGMLGNRRVVSGRDLEAMTSCWGPGFSPARWPWEPS